MSEKNPKISVCIPTYNRAEYITSAIQSVLNQNIEELEIIVVDDGSTDKTRELIKSLSVQSLKYIYKEHSGGPDTRNRAIDEARGEYLLWLDSDDVLIGNIIQEYLQAIEKYPEADVIYCDLLVADENLSIQKKFRYENWYGRNAELQKKFFFENPIPNGGTLIRRTAYTRIGKYTNEFRRAHDYEWFSRAVSQLNFLGVGKEGYIWRWHSTNMSSGTVQINHRYEERIIGSLLNSSLPFEVRFAEEYQTKESCAKLWMLLANRLAGMNRLESALLCIKNAGLYFYDSQILSAEAQVTKMLQVSRKESPPKHRVLFVLHNYVTNWKAGTENYSHQLARQLVKDGFEVAVFFPTECRECTKYTLVFDELDGVKLFNVQYPGIKSINEYLTNPEFEKRFKAVLDVFSPDIVHIHHLLRFPFSLVEIAKRTGRKVVVTLHDFWFICQRVHLIAPGRTKICSGPDSPEKCTKCFTGENGQGFNELLEFMKSRFSGGLSALEQADSITSPTHFLAEIFKKAGLRKEVKIRQLGMSYSFQNVPISPPDKTNFVFIGSIQPLKNLSCLVSAFKQFKGQATLSIYGNGAVEDIKNLVRDIQNDNRIKYYGEYDPEQLEDILKSATAIVAPSLIENYSLVLREALMAGVPVIASRRGGNPEIINDGINGFLIDPEDVNSLLNVFIRITTTPEILQEIRKNIQKPKSIIDDALDWAKDYALLINERRRKVSIIIPVYNNIEFTKKCLESIYFYTDEKFFEIILVDNGSTDGTKNLANEYLVTKRNFIYLENQKNLGFAIANNIAAKRATGDFLLFLNNDTEVRKGWLEPLIASLENDSDTAVVGAKLLFSDGTIQHAGVILGTDERNTYPLTARHIYYSLPGNYEPANYPTDYKALTAACLMVRRDEFLNMGGFDERYWNGYEDIDLCLRFYSQGRKLRYEPFCQIIHHESKSGPERFSRAEKNMQLLNEQWFGKVDADYIINSRGETVKTYKSKGRSLTSVIIPLYNNAEYTKLCVNSLYDSTDCDFELILVDNASSDETPEYLKELQKRRNNIVVITNKVNLGFPGAVNIGIKVSRGEYLVIANNDLLFTRGWLERMIELAEHNSQFGIVGPVSNFVSGLQLVTDAVYKDVPALNKFAAERKKEFNGDFILFPRVAFLCTLIKREVIEKLGGLDERFAPGNFEDDDYCLRAQEAGFKTVIAKDVFIHHFGSKSFKADGEKIYAERLAVNKNIFINKWGADPEEIWLYGKAFRKRNVTVPLHRDSSVEKLNRALLLINENDFFWGMKNLESALMGVERDSELIRSGQLDNIIKLYKKLALSDSSNNGYQKVEEHLIQIGYLTPKEPVTLNIENRNYI